MRYEDGECGDFGYWIEDTVTGEKIENEKVVALLNNLYDENRELRQILNDIVSATDETYTKTENIYKVTFVLDSERYLKICECLK